MADFSVTGKRVVVVGGGRSGVAAAELLAARGASVVLSEEHRTLPEADRLRAAGVALELGGHGAETLAHADLIVVSPGVPLDRPEFAAARRSGVPIVGEIELASRWIAGRIVAITGTKGKSTTAVLAGRMLEQGGVPVAVGGNIGQPLSGQIRQSSAGTVHVVEVSSFQLETTDRFHPWIAVLLNLSADHLDRHRTFARYVEAKARMFANQRETDWAVVNADDPVAMALANRGRARQLRFATDQPLGEGIVVTGGSIVYRTADGAVPLVPLTAIRLIGPHLLGDVLAAAAVGRLAGVSAEAMTRAVEGFSGLEHVLEPVAEIGGVRFVNDSKATNVVAARRAIESFAAGVVAILGGRFKGGELGDLREPLASRGVAVVALGEARPLVRETLEDLVPVHEADSMASAVRAAFAAAPPGGTVLLAPACASFDMFRDYAERGQVFKREVARLAEEVGRIREQ